jgi:thiamine monophosphate synthase
VHDALEAAGEDWSDYIHLGQRPHDMMPLRLARGRPNTIGRSMKSGYWI